MAMPLFAGFAAAEQKADLYTKDDWIHFSDDHPSDGDTITIHATLENKGDEDAGNFSVTFYDHYANGSEKIDEVWVRELAKGSTYNVSTEWEAGGEGQHTIAVVVDEDDHIDESDEGNNEAEKEIEVGSDDDDAAVYGRVTDRETGDGIREARVIVKKGDYVEDAYTNDEGDYEIDLEEGGEYTIKIKRSGYRTHEGNFSVDDGGRYSYNASLEKEEEKEGKISGYTKEKTNGTHIAHVNVRLYQGERIIGNTTSDGNGWYEFNELDEGNYTVWANKEGYKEYEEHLYLGEGEQKTHHIRMEKESGGGGTRVYGYVKEKGSGEPINDAQVSITYDENESYTVYTDSDGYYETELEHGGEYTVAAEKDGYEPEDKRVYIEDGEEKRVDLHLKEEGGGEETWIYGYVKENGTDEPIDNAKIRITGKDCNCSWITHTDSKGYYDQEIEGDHNYTVVAEKDGYESQEKHAYVEEGEEKRVDFRLKKETGGEDTVLEGYTKKKDSGEHIPNVEVTVSKGEFSETTHSDEEGFYRFELEEGGTYELRAEKEGYEPTEENVSVEEGEETTHHIRMVKESGGKETWIFGHVKEKGTGEPINDAEITITDGERHNYTAYTNEDGYYEKKLEHGGEYTVVAEKDGYETEDKRVSIEDGEEKRVDFHLKKETGLKRLYGTIHHLGHAVKGAFVHLVGAHCNCSYDTTSNENGSYEFNEVHDGEFYLIVEKDGYERYEEIIDIPEEGDGKHHDVELTEEASPGLMIKSIEFSNVRPVEGDIMVIEVTVKNRANETRSAALKVIVEPGEMRYRDEKVLLDINITLEAGRIASYSAQWNTTGHAGWNIITTWLDGDEEGGLSEEIYVREPDDLSVELSADRYRIAYDGMNAEIITVTVKNTGSIADTYTLSAEFPDSGWNVTVASTEITLEPGGSHSFSVTVIRTENLTSSLTVMVTAVSNTDPSVFDRIYINVEIDEGDDGVLPGFDGAVVAGGIGLGVIAFFRRSRTHGSRKV